jgi:hypothetical protein
LKRIEGEMGRSERSADSGKPKYEAESEWVFVSHSDRYITMLLMRGFVTIYPGNKSLTIVLFFDKHEVI